MKEKILTRVALHEGDGTNFYLIRILLELVEKQRTLLASVNVQQIVNGKTGQELRATEISELLTHTDDVLKRLVEE